MVGCSNSLTVPKIRAVPGGQPSLASSQQKRKAAGRLVTTTRVAPTTALTPATTQDITHNQDLIRLRSRGELELQSWVRDQWQPGVATQHEWLIGTASTKTSDSTELECMMDSFKSWSRSRFSTQLAKLMTIHVYSSNQKHAVNLAMALKGQGGRLLLRGLSQSRER